MLVTEFFGNERGSSIIVPEGRSFAGWNHCGGALLDLLVVNPSKGISLNQEQPYCQLRRSLVQGLSYLEMVKKGVVKEKQSLRIEISLDGKRLIRWVSQSNASKTSKGNVFSRLGPKFSVFSRLGPGLSSQVPSSSISFTRKGKKKGFTRQIWVPKVKEKSPLAASLGIHFNPSFGLVVYASDKIVSSPICLKGASQAEGCAASPPISPPSEKNLQTGNTDVEEKVAETQASKDIFSASVSDSSSRDEDLDIDLSYVLEDQDEEGLFTHNLQKLE